LKDADKPTSFKQLVAMRAQAFHLESCFATNSTRTLADRKRRYPRIDEISIPLSTEWVDIDIIPTTANFGSLVDSADPKAGSLAVYDANRIVGKWRQKQKTIPFTPNTPMDFIRVLRYPLVVGRISPYTEMKQYDIYGVPPRDPWVPSDIYIMDLVSGTTRKLCPGIYAIPLQ
jgi:hypothetical protein